MKLTTPGIKTAQNPGGFKPIRAHSESELGLGEKTAPSLLYPGGCEGSHALDRQLNAPLEAAGQSQALQKKKRCRLE